MFNYYTNSFIDTFQNGKKTFVQYTVKHDKLAEVLNQFVDAQTQYTKSFVNTMMDLGTNLYRTVSTPNFTQEITEGYGLDKFATVAKASSKKAK